MRNDLRYGYMHHPWGEHLHIKCLRAGVVCETQLALPEPVLARLPHVVWKTRQGLRRFYWNRMGQGVRDEDTVEGLFQEAVYSRERVKNQTS